MNKKKPYLYPLKTIVQIAWKDACITGGWDSRDSYLEQVPVSVVSVGFLLERNSKYVTIITSQSPKGTMNQALTIPRPWIVNILILTPLRKRVAQNVEKGKQIHGSSLLEAQE